MSHDCSFAYLEAYLWLYTQPSASSWQGPEQTLHIPDDMHGVVVVVTVTDGSSCPTYRSRFGEPSATWSIIPDVASLFSSEIICTAEALGVFCNNNAAAPAT